MFILLDGHSWSSSSMTVPKQCQWHGQKYVSQGNTITTSSGWSIEKNNRAKNRNKLTKTQIGIPESPNGLDIFVQYLQSFQPKTARRMSLQIWAFDYPDFWMAVQNSYFLLCLLICFGSSVAKYNLSKNYWYSLDLRFEQHPSVWFLLLICYCQQM